MQVARCALLLSPAGSGDIILAAPRSKAHAALRPHAGQCHSQPRAAPRSPLACHATSSSSLRSFVDVRRDRERTRPGETRGSQQQGGSNEGQAIGDRSRGANMPPPPGGIPAGSYRDANGIPRSLAVDHPLIGSLKSGGLMGPRSVDDGAAYGTSYTNRKTREYDLLNDIVKQTRHNFIDVSAKSAQLDEEDLIERGQKYAKNLSEIPTSDATHTSANNASYNSFGVYYSAMDLPPPSSDIVKRVVTRTSDAGRHAPSALAAGIAQRRSSFTGEVDYASLVHLLATAAVAGADVEFAAVASSQLAAAIAADSAQPSEGKIVLTFEELLQDK